MSLSFQPAGLIKTRASDIANLSSRSNNGAVILTRDGDEALVSTFGTDNEAQDVSAFLNSSVTESSPQLSERAVSTNSQYRARILGFNLIRSRLLINRKQVVAAIAALGIGIVLLIAVLVTSHSPVTNSDHASMLDASILSNDPTVNPMYSPKRTMLKISSDIDVPFVQISNIAKNQIDQYKAGTGLILGIHIFRQAGTDFCASFGRAPGTIGTTEFGCRLPESNKYTFTPPPGFPFHDPWYYNETSSNIAMVRKYFHLIQWRFDRFAPNPPLRSTDFEDNNLVSVIIVRDPIDRLLSGNGWLAVHYHPILDGTASHQMWWEYANTTHGETDNYQLRILAGFPCCNGADTDPIFLEYAKALMLRFSVVMDIECLDQSFDALADLLGLTIDRLRDLAGISTEEYDQLTAEQAYRRKMQHQGYRKNNHLPVDKRIPYQDVYDFLLARNKLDIELYEWAKSISIVNCAAVPSKPTLAPTPSPKTTSTLRPTFHPTQIVAPTARLSGRSLPTSFPTISMHPTITDRPTVRALFEPVRATEAPNIASFYSNVSGIVTIQAGGKQYNVSKQAAEQIDSYRKGSGLIVNIQIAHQGGKTFCAIIGNAVGSVGSNNRWSCTGGTPQDISNYPSDVPWTYNETATNVAFLRHYYHMISWVFNDQPVLPIADTNWDDPNLVSVFIIRDPVSRMLASDSFVGQNYPGILEGNATLDTWWKFAKSDITNNFCLGILAGPGCCQGGNTNPTYLGSAKEVMKRFTFILNIDCLIEGMQAMADILGITLDSSITAASSAIVNNETRVPFPQVYSYLLQRNKLDVALYDWAKTRALVEC